MSALATERLSLLPAIPPGPGPYEFVKASVSAEGSRLRLLLVAREYDGRKLHVWEFLPREATPERLQGALADLWRRLGEA